MLRILVIASKIMNVLHNSISKKYKLKVFVRLKRNTLLKTKAKKGMVYQ